MSRASARRAANTPCVRSWRRWPGRSMPAAGAGAPPLPPSRPARGVRPTALQPAVAAHQAVLQLAEEAGLRHGADRGKSLEREKAEYALRGAYVGWATASGPRRISAM